MSKLFALFAGGVLVVVALSPVQSAVAAQVSVQPTSARSGEVWTVRGVPEATEISWSLLRDGRFVHSLGVTFDREGVARIVVPDVEPGPYELVGVWGPQERGQRLGGDVVVLDPSPQPLETQIEEPLPDGSGRGLARRQAGSARPDESVGFRVVADPTVSFAIDGGLLVIAAIVVWRSRWIRQIVVETVRHPRTPVTLERDGAGVVRRSVDGAAT